MGFLCRTKPFNDHSIKELWHAIKWLLHNASMWSHFVRPNLWKGTEFFLRPLRGFTCPIDQPDRLACRTLLVSTPAAFHWPPCKTWFLRLARNLEPLDVVLSQKLSTIAAYISPLHIFCRLPKLIGSICQRTDARLALPRDFFVRPNHLISQNMTNTLPVA